jgi:hypothetical protein
MNDLIIGNSQTDGVVMLKYNAEQLVFEGRFMPENTKEYFQPILDWVDAYLSSDWGKAEIVFKLDYFNTSFSKKILDLLTIFEEAGTSSKPVTVKWFTKKGDTDLQDAGKGYAEMSDLKFVFEEY